MNRSPLFAPHVRRRSWRNLLVLAFLVCIGLTPLLRAQSSTPAGGPTATLADDPSLAFAPSNLAPANSGPSSSPIYDPFKPRPKFGISPGSTEGGLGFNSTVSGFGVGVRGTSGSNQFGSPGLSGPRGNMATFFSTDGLATGPATGPARGSGRTFEAVPGTLPSLDQLMRANLRVPFGSSSAAFRLSYQERFGSVGSSSGPDFSHMLATGMFTSSDLGNGMFLSAGTGSGGHSMAGAPAASLGNGSGAPKHSGPSVAIKLSF